MAQEDGLHQRGTNEAHLASELSQEQITLKDHLSDIEAEIIVLERLKYKSKNQHGKASFYGRLRSLVKDSREYTSLIVYYFLGSPTDSLLGLRVRSTRKPLGWNNPRKSNEELENDGNEEFTAKLHLITARIERSVYHIMKNIVPNIRRNHWLSLSMVLISSACRVAMSTQRISDILESIGIRGYIPLFNARKEVNRKVICEPVISDSYSGRIFPDKTSLQSSEDFGEELN